VPQLLGNLGLSRPVMGLLYMTNYMTISLRIYIRLLEHADVILRFVFHHIKGDIIFIFPGMCFDSLLGVYPRMVEGINIVLTRA
jgi:hypothetical protein